MNIYVFGMNYCKLDIQSYTNEDACSGGLEPIEVIEGQNSTYYDRWWFYKSSFPDKQYRLIWASSSDDHVTSIKKSISRKIQ